MQSLPVRGAWIEIWAAVSVFSAGWSLPVRGAWIEIMTTSKKNRDSPVAPRKGSVD